MLPSIISGQLHSMLAFIILAMQGMTRWDFARSIFQGHFPGGQSVAPAAHDMYDCVCNHLWWLWDFAILQKWWLDRSPGLDLSGLRVRPAPSSDPSSLVPEAMLKPDLPKCAVCQSRMGWPSYVSIMFWCVVSNMFFMFHNIWDNPSHWLLFFWGVETCWNHQPVFALIFEIAIRRHMGVSENG